MTLIQIRYRRVFNCYLTTEDDGVTLVDTGPVGALPAIREELRRARGPLRRIVLTHAHDDHVGGLDELVDEHGTQVDVIVGRNEADLLAERGARTAPTRLVDDGELVGSLKVIATPGHTPGHISLLDTRDGTLITGDAVTTLGRTAVSGDLVWRWPFPAFATWDKEIALESAGRLLAADPARLASGHGPIVPYGAASLQAAILRASAA
jgi:glyoxylase-like metal-dependent hydrolase (beta-lactamase superfamily II)